MARRRHPVTSTHTSASPPTLRRDPMSDTELNDYRAAGLTASDAHRLRGAHVTPDDFWEWTRLCGVTFSTRKIAVLAQQGVTHEHVRTFPAMTYSELATIVSAGITDEKTAHSYGHALGWCCGYPQKTPAAWSVLPAIVRTGESPSQLGRYLDTFHTIPNAKFIPTLIGMKIPGRLITQMPTFGWSVSGIIAARTLWRTWVEAANGHVAVADAVVNAGGVIDDVSGWLNTGETPERIAALIAAGTSPTIVSHSSYGELNDDDLAVWAALTGG